MSCEPVTHAHLVKFRLRRLVRASNKAHSKHMCHGNDMSERTDLIMMCHDSLHLAQCHLLSARTRPACAQVQLWHGMIFRKLTSSSKCVCEVSFCACNSARQNCKAATAISLRSPPPLSLIRPHRVLVHIPSQPRGELQLLYSVSLCAGERVLMTHPYAAHVAP